MQKTKSAEYMPLSYFWLLQRCPSAKFAAPQGYCRLDQPVQQLGPGCSTCYCMDALNFTCNVYTLNTLDRHDVSLPQCINTLLLVRHLSYGSDAQNADQHNDGLASSRHKAALHCPGTPKLLSMVVTHFFNMHDL